jgi:hypothetical protein
MDRTSEEIFGSRERFEEYLSKMGARLQARRAERIAFLTEARSQLDPLLREAQLLGDSEAESDLQARLGVLHEELERLAGLGSGDSTEQAIAPFSPDVEVREPLSSDSALGAPATLPPGPPNGTANEPVALEAPPAETPAIATAAPSAPAPKKLAPPMPVAPPAPARARGWEPRPIDEIDLEVARLEEQLDQYSGSGETGLLTLKAIACRQRRAYMELEEQASYIGHVRALHGRIRAMVQEQHGERYVLPLNTGVSPEDPARWEDLAQSYEALVQALEAFAWFCENATALHTPESRTLLEGVGAAQQRLFRLLETHFRGALDDQQRVLYESILEAAGGLDIYVEALNPHRAERDLEIAARDLPATFRRLREALEKKQRQEQTTESLLTLVSDPAFGVREQDADALRAAALACMAAGVPPSNKTVRDALLPWGALLEDEPGVSRLTAEISKELDRRAQRGLPVEPEEEEGSSSALAADIQAMREVLLPHTRGKRCLFIGGDAREEKRRELEQVLELEELVWPEARKTASVYDFEAEIARCDIAALLIRFMRTGFAQADELCREHRTRLVRLPRGLGVPRVITDFYQQLVPRDPTPQG